MAASIGQSQAPPRMKDYVFTEKLGCGTYATVYKAYRKVKNNFPHSDVDNRRKPVMLHTTKNLSTSHNDVNVLYYRPYDSGHNSTSGTISWIAIQLNYLITELFYAQFVQDLIITTLDRAP